VTEAVRRTSRIVCVLAKQRLARHRLAVVEQRTGIVPSRQTSFECLLFGHVAGVAEMMQIIKGHGNADNRIKYIDEVADTPHALVFVFNCQTTASSASATGYRVSGPEIS